MDFSEAAERISRKFSKDGQPADPKKIEGKLRRLVQEFGVQPSEAERSVTNELAKDTMYSLPDPVLVVRAGAGPRRRRSRGQRPANG